MNQNPDRKNETKDGGNGDKAPILDRAPEAAGAASRRKPYSAPVLMEYGTIAKLTQGTRTRNNDGANTRKRKRCL